MIQRVLEFALGHRAFVLLVTLGIAIAGTWSAMHLPIDAVPNITGVQVQINTEIAALAAEESEKLVTQPIELAMAGLPGMDDMRSVTKFGLSQVTLNFKDGTEIYRARQLVTERLQGVLDRLPVGSSPKLAPNSDGLGEILYYNVRYKEGTTNKPPTEMEQLIALREMQTYLIKPLLLTVPGIAEINETGGYQKQFVIQPKPEALEAIGMTFDELAELVSQNVENSGGGIINRGGQQLTIRSVSRVANIEDLANLPVKFGAGIKPLRVKDVAEVKIGTKFRTGAATIDGRETVIGTTMMLAGQNSRELTERVKARLADIQTKLPSGVEIQIIYDRSQLIDRAITTVKKNLFEGALFVVVLLLVLLGNWRAAIIVTTAIPLSFLFALTGMVQGNISGNLMSLGAIDFGLIIDGAVVIVDNIVRQLGQQQHQRGRPLTDGERKSVIISASQQVGRPMFFGVVIITVVYLPILALTGIEGKMFHPMALTVMFALVGALVLAFTTIPVLCFMLLRGTIRETESVILQMSKRIYEPILSVAIRFRWMVVFSASILFLGSLWLFSRLGAEFVPKLDEGSITLMLYKPVGMNIEESLRTDIEVSKKLAQDFPEITRVFSRIGTSEVASDPMPPNESDLYISYKPLSEWSKTKGRPKNKAELIEQIDATIKQVNSDYNVLMAQPIEMRVNEMLEGTKSDLAVKIFGEDFEVLEKIAGQIKEILEKVPGVAQVEFETESQTPQLQINVKREALQRHGLQAASVNRTIHAALAGKFSGTIVEGNKNFDIVVRMPEELRGDLEHIKKLPVRVGETGLVPLGTLVDFSTIDSFEPIQHDDGHRRSALMVNLKTRDLEGFVLEAQKRIEAQVKLPENYMVEFGGQYKNLQEARSRLTVIVPLALAFIFILIYMALGSVTRTLMVFSGIPLAVTGGVFALWIRDMPFSITAAVGFIALSGVAVLNGLVLVAYFNQLQKDSKSIQSVVLEGSVTRLRPVLMTALVAAMGFLPMAVATGAGAEVQRPLATVVIGGILSSTFLTLILLPVLYAWIEKVKVNSEDFEVQTVPR